MAGPRSPTSPVTAQLVSRRWRIISFGYCADFQRRSNERLVVVPQKRSRAFHGVEDFIYLDGTKLFKNARTYGWAVFPQTRLVLFTVLKNHFVWMSCNHAKTFKFMAGPRSPTNLVTAQLNLRRWKIVSFWCNADFQQRSNERMVLFLQTRSRSIRGDEKPFRLNGVKRFKNIRTYGWVVLPQTRPSSFYGVEESTCMGVMQPCLSLGRAPQHPLSRRSSFRGVEESFRFDVMRTFTNVQINGWSCSPKHGPAHLTVWKNFFVWMLWSFSKTFEPMAGPCSPKHSSNFFTVLKNMFVWMTCYHLKTLKLMPEPRSPTSPVTAQLILRRWSIISFWCCADFQQRSNERMVVLLQTRSS